MVINSHNPALDLSLTPTLVCIWWATQAILHRRGATLWFPREHTVFICTNSTCLFLCAFCLGCVLGRNNSRETDPNQYPHSWQQAHWMQILHLADMAKFLSYWLLWTALWCLINYATLYLKECQCAALLNNHTSVCGREADSRKIRSERLACLVNLSRWLPSFASVVCS